VVLGVVVWMAIVVWLIRGLATVVAVIAVRLRRGRTLGVMMIAMVAVDRRSVCLFLG